MYITTIINVCYQSFLARKLDTKKIFKTIEYYPIKDLNGYRMCSMENIMFINGS